MYRDRASGQGITAGGLCAWSHPLTWGPDPGDWLGGAADQRASLTTSSAALGRFVLAQPARLVRATEPPLRPREVHGARGEDCTLRLEGTRAELGDRPALENATEQRSS